MQQAGRSRANAANGINKNADKAKQDAVYKAVAIPDRQTF